MTADETQYDDRVYRRLVTNSQINEPKLTVCEVAKLLNVSKMTVYRLIHAGDLSAYRIGTGKKQPLFRVPVSAVREYLAKAQAEDGAA